MWLMQSQCTACFESISLGLQLFIRAAFRIKISLNIISNRFSNKRAYTVAKYVIFHP